jgi:hypothetical protein
VSRPAASDSARNGGGVASRSDVPRESAPRPAAPPPPAAAAPAPGPAPLAPAALAPVAPAPAPAVPPHAGGSAQSRGCARRGGRSPLGSPSSSLSDVQPSHGPAGRSPSSARGTAPCVEDVTAEAEEAARVAAPASAARCGSSTVGTGDSTGTAPGVVGRAASRRAQSWNTGQPGNEGERQKASWWASARGSGRPSAKQRWR